MSELDENLKFYEQPVFVNFLLLIFNITLFVLKLIFSTLTRSVALQADAFDSMTDIVMNLTALIGIFFTKKKPNEKFPYGYYKMENIISLFFSLFIFFTVYNIVIQSFNNILAFYAGHSRMIYSSPLIFLFLIISLSASLFIALYLKKVSKRTGSPIIESEAQEKLFDCLISSSVLISFIGALWNLNLLDSIIGLIIAIFIFKGGYDIFLISTKTLLDAVIDFDKRTELIKVIEEYPRVKSLKNVQVRSYGKYIFMQAEIILNKNMTLSQIRTLKDKLSKKIMIKFPEIFKIILLAQAQEKRILRIAVPVSDREGLNSEIFDHFGESPYFAFLDFQEGSLLKFEIIPNKFINEEKRKGILISDWLCATRIDKLYLTKELKKGPQLVFINSLIEVELTEFNILNDILIKELESNDI